MNRHQIADLLDDSDHDSSSSLSTYDDTDEDPDWENDENDNQGEDNNFDEENEVIREWNDNFELPNINSNIIFNPDISWYKPRHYRNNGFIRPF